MRRIPVAWTHCPNCDAELSTRVFVGDYYDCAECGESGQRQSGPYDTEPVVRYMAWDFDTTESIPALYPASDDLAF